MVVKTLLVPNILKASVDEIEQFYTLVGTLPQADQYAFDMHLVNFVTPYGVLALVNAARHLSTHSSHPILLENLATQVHLYLHRMNIFDIGCNWMRPERSLEEQWAHSPQTTNLLELTPVTGSHTVAVVLERAERIFSRWLKTPNLGNLLSVLSELCSSIYQHSGDPYGCVLIQKYDMTACGQVKIHLAVGDLGCGIRHSLMTRYGEIGKTPLDYLHQAMQGRTARLTGRGGLGLRLVEHIATNGDGHLWIRSDSAALFRSGSQTTQEWGNLTSFPGTQIAVMLCVSTEA